MASEETEAPGSLSPGTQLHLSPAALSAPAITISTQCCRDPSLPQPGFPAVCTQNVAWLDASEWHGWVGWWGASCTRGCISADLEALAMLSPPHRATSLCLGARWVQVLVGHEGVRAEKQTSWPRGTLPALLLKHQPCMSP